MMISTVANEYGTSWDRVCELSAIEFLNVYVFVLAKKQREIEISEKSLRNLKNKVRK